MTKKNPTIDLNELLTAAQAAEILHVKVRTLTEWRWHGKGPKYIRLGKKGSAVLYERRSLADYLLARMVRPVGVDEEAA